jgi:hypothetical protein
MALNETVTAGQSGHLTDHAALKAEFVSQGWSPLPADYTSSTTGAQHAAIHNILHARHNALGAATTLPTNLTTITSAGHLAHTVALHAAYNLRSAPAVTQNLFTSQVPGSFNQDDGQGVTLGMRFTASVDGSVGGVRFYRSSAPPASAIGLLYDDSGTELARATFGTLTTGWNAVTFTTPVAVTAGAVYRVAYWTSSSYVLSTGLFPLTNDKLTASGGCYMYGATPAAPTNTSTGAYFADPTFTYGGGGTTTAPGTPAAPTVAARDASVLVSWVAPSGGTPSGYDVQQFVGSTGGAVTSVGNVLSTTVTGLTNGTAYTFKVRASNTAGTSAYSPASSSVTPVAATTGGGAAVTHGDQLTTAHVGPWTLQGVAKGSEVLQVMTAPSRGYWRMDAPDEFSTVASNYVYNNDPTNHGGVVPTGGMTIDGYTVAAGTRVIQFRDFSASEFYVQGQGGSYLFRGCKWLTDQTSGSSTFNDYVALSTWSNALHYCQMGAPTKEGNAYGAFWKSLGGSGHRVLRCYTSNGLVGFQPNRPNFEITETIIENIPFYYGELGTSGLGDNSVIHINGISVEGGASNLTIQRCKILIPSPDGATGANGSAAGQSGYGTQSGQIGYGAGTNPGRLVGQTDCIAVFAISASNNGVTIKDNLLGGSGYVLYAGNADGNGTNIAVTGNKFTTKWWTNGGSFGPLSDAPVWGSNGNVKSGNVWADDYGTGGNGCTALADRQYPTGNGPRAGTSVF